MDEAIRTGKTEAVFRDVNERIAESAARFEAEETEFVCECSDDACTERIEATLDEYEDVRTEPTQFLLKPGHEDDRYERVVERRPGYRIVEKFHEVVAETVRRLDPRAEPA